MEKDGKLYTPPAGNILPGITRSIVKELAHANGIEVIESFFKPEEITGADGAFLTGTAVEIKAVGQVNGQPFNLPWEETFGALLQKQFHHQVRGQKVSARKTKVA